MTTIKSKKGPERHPFTVSSQKVFLEKLPVHREKALQIATGSHPTSRVLITDLRASCSMIFLLRTESFGLFQSFREGSDTYRVTDSIEFAGCTRYIIRNTMLRGVLRRILASVLRGDGCSEIEPCGMCALCRLFGYMRGGDRSGNSRIEVMESASVEARTPCVVTSRSVDIENPIRRDAEVVPPGTHFLTIIRLTEPTLQDIADVVLGMEYAGQHGIGARTATGGKLSVKPLAILGGYWTQLGSPWPILETITEPTPAGIEMAVRAYLDKISRGLPYLMGDELEDAINAILPLSALYPRHEVRNEAA